VTPWPDTVSMPPWQHQHAAYDTIGRLWYHGAPGAGLFAGCGTGKSLTAAALIEAFGFRRVLIVGLTSMVSTWPKMLANYIPHRYETVPLVGPLVGRARMIDALRGDNRKPFVAVVNHETIWREPLATALLSWQPECVIVDESQAIKSAGSRVSKFAHRLAKQTRYRLAMTGTPMHDNPLDLYGQFRFIDDRVFGTRYDVFLNQYAIVFHGPKFTQVKGYQRLDELWQRISTITVYVPDTAVDLPELVIADRHFRLAPKVRELYDKFAHDLIVEIGTGDVVATNALTKLLRLQQITCGYVPTSKLPDTIDGDPAPMIVANLGHERRDALIDLVSELPPSEPLVVACRFHADLDNVQDVATIARRRYMEQSGRRQEWEEWQYRASGNEIIGVQIQSGSAGIELTRARFAVAYSLGFSLGDWEQFTKRLHRPGARAGDAVRIWRLVGVNTVDEQIVGALDGKHDVVTEVYKHAEREALRWLPKPKATTG